jgi:hypothetical protein
MLEQDANHDLTASTAIFPDVYQFNLNPQPDSPHLAIRSHLKRFSSLLSEKRTKRDQQGPASQGNSKESELAKKKKEDIRIEDMAAVGHVNGVKVSREWTSCLGV